MNAEDAIKRFVDSHSSEEWIDHSDGYQFLLENCGSDLLPGLLQLGGHKSPEVRALVASLLATRRPHTEETVDLFCRFLDDPQPIVRVAALDHLSELGDLGLRLMGRVAEKLTDGEGMTDSLEKVLAIKFLLHHDRELWWHFVDDLFDVLSKEKGTLAEYAAFESLISLGLVETKEV